MKKFYLSILLALFTVCQADIQRHFKHAIGKENTPPCQLRNVDFIYVINLDQRPGKWAHCLKELTPYGIYPYRFSAVNGWEITLDTLNQLGVKYDKSHPRDLWGTAYLPGGDFMPHHEVMQVLGRNYFCHCMTRGAIGIVLSHLSILQDAYDSGYETVWIMEDDIEVIQNPHLLSDLIDRLDGLVGKSWDILFTDRDTKSQNGSYVECHGTARRPDFTPVDKQRLLLRFDISPDFRRIGLRYGAYSMIVRRAGMKKILDFYRNHNIFLPYDMEFYFPPGIAFYTVTSDVVSTQPRAESDNGAPGYKNPK